MRLEQTNRKTMTERAKIKPLSQVPPSVSIPFSRSLSTELKFNNHNKRPLKSNSQNLSFKGLFYKPVLDEAKNVAKFNSDEILEITKKHLGSSVNELFDYLKDSKYAKNQVSIKGNEVTFNKKTIPHLLYDGIAYPIKVLPGEILNGIVGFMRKIRPLSNWADGLYNTERFIKIRERAKIDSNINNLRGIFETVEGLKGKSPEEISSELLKQSLKPFDVKTGNYDTKHERSLTRIVSGFIPAVFLANDAYNLSRMCNDNEKEAKAEKKVRFRQETSRVLIQAYITLITMGAIQKHINSSKFAVMANVGLTALFTEAISRLSAGKSIIRLSPEKAKEINKKNGLVDKEGKEPINPYQEVFFQSNERRKAFASFSGQEKDQTKGANEIKKDVSLEKKQEPKKEPLLSFSKLVKGLIGTIVVGYAFKGLRQNAVVEKNLQKIFKLFNDAYKKITAIPNKTISSADFEKILSKLRESGFNEIADKYVEIAEKNKLYSADKKFINLGKKDKTYVKPLVDFIIGPFKFTWNVLEGPYYWTNKLVNAITKQTPKEVKKVVSETEIFSKSIQSMSKEALKENFKPEVFKSYVKNNMLKAFNKENVSGISNSDLANLAKTAVFATTLPFLMSDNYNIVMLKSNGEDKEGAQLKYRERLVQESSRFFYSTLLISLFNNTFQAQYHKSLFGAAWITAACTVIGEILNRKSVGVPVGTYSRSEIMEQQRQRENASPAVKSYYRFMARLTGKKSIAEIHEAKQNKIVAKA